MNDSTPIEPERPAVSGAVTGSAAVEPPYIVTTRIVEDRHYNAKFGDDRVCKCGHAYHRHFDTYEKMRACGCKYCQCYTFDEATGEQPNGEHSNTPTPRP